jgi:hypothetical protein
MHLRISSEKVVRSSSRKITKRWHSYGWWVNSVHALELTSAPIKQLNCRRIRALHRQWQSAWSPMIKQKASMPLWRMQLRCSFYTNQKTMHVVEQRGCATNQQPLLSWIVRHTLANSKNARIMKLWCYMCDNL